MKLKRSKVKTGTKITRMECELFDFRLRPLYSWTSARQGWSLWNDVRTFLEAR